MSDQQLAVKDSNSLDELERMSKSIAASGMFGFSNPAQALTLMLLCKSEGLDPISALRRYFIIEGKPSMRSDAMLGEFLSRGGGVIWHIRGDEMCAATLFADKTKIDDNARARAADRFDKLWALDAEDDPVKRSEMMIAIAKLSHEGEETIIRTLADADSKKISMSWKWKDKNDHSKGGDWKKKTNWDQNPRAMLTARVITEGVRLISPGLIAGIYDPDEVQDIVRREHEEREEFVEGALGKPASKILSDLAAMEEMIAVYDEELQTAKGNRKQELLGLKSELVCKIADLKLEEEKKDEIPGLEKPQQVTQPIEAELLPPEKWQDYVLRHVKQKTLRGKRLGDYDAESLKVIASKISPISDEDSPAVKLEKRMIFQAAEESQKGK